MSRRRLLWLGAGFALVVTIAVIVLAGLYDNLALLVLGQVPLIFLPTFLPFRVLAARNAVSTLAVAVIAAPLVMGWGYVIYVERQPYAGGGASMAVLLGWAACLVSTLLAMLVTLLLTNRR
ncbi:hypothetical protein [Sphingomonas sp. LHG3443-2]|uniref:hypothetical protein n=1 Tax=Sphingomonas sp. LHG3443-2 TaxID=2804639 RepID=UPI003CEBEFAA